MPDPIRNLQVKTFETQTIAAEKTTRAFQENKKEYYLVSGKKDRFVVSEEKGPGVLAHKDSGKYKYPETHSVFTPVDSSTLMTPICSSVAVTRNPEEFKDFLRSLNGKFVNNNLGGTAYNRGIAEAFYNAKGDENLKDLILSSENRYKEETWGPRKMVRVADPNSASGFSNRLIVDTQSQHSGPWNLKPLHRIARLSDETELSEAKEFEVLLVSGYGRTDQDKQFEKQYGGETGIFKDVDRLSIDLLCLETGLEANLADRCQAITNLTAPTKAEFVRSLKKHAQSIKDNNRQLLIIYIGHGNSFNTRSDSAIAPEHKNLEGAKEGVLKFRDVKYNQDGLMYESEYKKLMNTYLETEDVIHVLSGCKIGGAITDTNDINKFANMS